MNKLHPGEKEDTILLNGEITSDPLPQPSDESSEELYEVFRVEEGVALFIEDHIARLCRSIISVGLTPTPTAEQLIGKLAGFLKIHNKTEGNVRVSFFYRLPGIEMEAWAARFIKHHYPEKELYSTGVDCDLVSAERWRPSVKTANLPLREMSDAIIKKEKLFETILVNREGKITEGSRTNLFFVKNKMVITAPGEYVLEGIIRKKVIEVCHQLNYPLKYELPDAETDLANMEAAFLTGTSPRVLPIKRIGKMHYNPQNKMVQAIIKATDEKVHAYIAKKNNL